MKTTFTIINEIYQDEYTEVTINTPIGVFTGTTEPDEMDMPYLSTHHASEIALHKAIRKYAEEACKILKHEIKTLQDMVHEVYRGDPKPEGYHERAVIRGMLKQKQAEYVMWANRVDGITKYIKERIAARDMVVAKYYKKDKAE